jgi:hypothetical protein
VLVATLLELGRKLAVLTLPVIVGSHQPGVDRRLTIELLAAVIVALQVVP